MLLQCPLPCSKLYGHPNELARAQSPEGLGVPTRESPGACARTPPPEPRNATASPQNRQTDLSASAPSDNSSTVSPFLPSRELAAVRTPGVGGWKVAAGRDGG